MPARYLPPATISRLGNLKLVARLVVEGFLAGQHKSPFFGFNVEFSEHRQYMPGDDLKHLDWKLWAKCDKFYVKQYEENTCLRCFILMDVSRSMGFSSTAVRSGASDGASAGTLDPSNPEGVRMSKLTYARYLTAALSFLMLHQKDSVGVVTFSDRIHDMIFPRSTPSHLHLILEAIDRTAGGEKTDLAAIIQQVAGRIQRRALVVVISDFFDDYERVMKGVRYLKYLKHEPVLFQILAPDELDLPLVDLTHFVDMEDRSSLVLDPRMLREEYRSRMRGFLDRLSAQCSFHKIDHQLFTTADPLELALSRYLIRRSRS
jgi:uncharacterized protein (DUF58 family)